MRYSFSEFSPYSRQNYTQSIKPFDVKNTFETPERKGVPNYTTVIPATAEVVRMEEPPETTPNPEMERRCPPTMPGVTMPGSTPAAPTTPAMPRTMPGTAPTAPTQPAQPRTMPGATPTQPGTMPGMTMPGTTMPGMTMPGTTMPGMTMPGTTMPVTPGQPSTAPSSPGRTMPFQPTPQTPFMPRTTPPAQTQEYYNNPMDHYYMDSYMNGYNDYDDGYDDGYDDMMMPSMNMNSNIPMGIPLMPLYGYDNMEDADKDWDYMRQMYPMAAKQILGEIEEECDKLEYDGSCMYDEYPDRVYLSRIVDKVYDKVKHLIDDDTFVSPESLNSSENTEYSTAETIQYTQFFRDERRDERERRESSRRRFNSRDLIEILLINEMLHRRRRFRSRRRWF